MVTPAPSPAKAKATPNSPSSSSATTPANARGTAPATAPEASADTPAGTAQPKNKRKKLIRERGKRGGVKNKRKSSTSATASAPADASKTKANAKAGTAAATEHAVRIAAFHTLEKELARTSEPGLRAQLLAKQEKLGGLESYQDASLKGGDKMKGGESGKWCAQVFKEIRGDEPVSKTLQAPDLLVSMLSRHARLLVVAADSPPGCWRDCRLFVCQMAMDRDYEHRLEPSCTTRAQIRLFRLPIARNRGRE